MRIAFVLGLVEERTDSALASAIIDLLDNKKRYLSIAKESLTTAELFDMKNIGKKIEEEYCSKSKSCAGFLFLTN